MAKQTINIGSTADDGTGTTIRAGGDLINDNFNEIYTELGDGSSLSIASKTQTLTNNILMPNLEGIFSPSNRRFLDRVCFQFCDTPSQICAEL